MAKTLRERAKEANTLCCLLTGCVGNIVTVEFRNETKVTGMLERVEPLNMNMSLCDAVFIGTDESQVPFDSFYVQGKNVRFVQIPDEVDMLKTIKRQLDVVAGKRGHREQQKKQKCLTEREKRQRRKEFIMKRTEDLMAKLGINKTEG